MLDTTGRGVCCRLLAPVLIVCLLPSMPAGAASDPATLSGIVRSADGRAALAGARVFAGDPETGEIYPSDQTGENGFFEIRGLPPATYSLAVESNAGLYLVDLPVPLGEGVTRTVGISVNASLADDGGGGGNDDDEDDDSKAGSPYRSRRPHLWNNPLTAALLVIGLAVVFGFVIANATEDGDGFVEQGATDTLPL